MPTITATAEKAHPSPTCGHVRITLNVDGVPRQTWEMHVSELEPPTDEDVRKAAQVILSWVASLSGVSSRDDLVNLLATGRLEIVF